MKGADLVMAVSNRDIPRIESCLQQNTDIHFNFDSPLRTAVEKGFVDVAEYLLKRGADVHALQEAALMKAIGSKHIDMVALLLEYQADVHANDDLALRWAAGCDVDINVVYLLIERGADVFAQKAAPLCLAEVQNNLAVATYLHGVMETQKKNFLEILNTQTAIGEFLRAPYLQTGETALFRALRMGHIGIVIDKMKSAGDSFSMHDLFGTKDRHGKISFIQLAADTNSLSQIFRADIWQNRVSTLKEAWNAILPEWHQAYHTNKQVDIQSVAAKSHHLSMKQHQHKPTFKK